MFDLNYPFFRPLWVRVTVVLVCLAWAVLEFATDAPFWGTLFAGLGIYCGWRFFLSSEDRSSN
ncbi:DUF3329 domain-containing protein [Roseibium salinum]|uniref:DUF3329 domain-containing protein n=1 Tax=Roseibium salinum TaxID=1604349 RepID=A0ABT3QW89_9HYPH|nr:DUF3329 domain-containing protein [Roseibium sp. DSM 29163]MCX2721198.1 DUF3329 domain-containing protein [Roseibium sp. DSM 29163]